MPDINPSIPVVGQPNSTEEPKVVTALTQLIAAVNNVDTDQIADGTIVTADLGALAVTAPKIGVLPRCRVFRSTAQAITTATSTAIAAFDSETHDTDTMHDLVTNTGRITVKTAGAYVFGGSAELGPSSAGAGPTRQIAIRLNGATFIAISDHPANNSFGTRMRVVSSPWVCAVSDYFELVVFQDSGGALDVLANSADFDAHFVSA